MTVWRITGISRGRMVLPRSALLPTTRLPLTPLPAALLLVALLLVTLSLPACGGRQSLPDFPPYQAGAEFLAQQERRRLQIIADREYRGRLQREAGIRSRARLDAEWRRTMQQAGPHPALAASDR